LDLAAKWYIRAIEHGPHHSPQAEIGLTRITLKKPSVNPGQYSVEILIDRAEIQAILTDWSPGKEYWLIEVEAIKQLQAGPQIN
jgi:hypothetical protein